MTVRTSSDHRHERDADLEGVAGTGGSPAGPSWRDRRPVQILAVTILVALSGGGALHVATRTSLALLGLVGVVAATWAAWVTTDYVSARWTSRERGWRPFVVGAGLLGGALILVGNWWSWPFVAFVGLVAATIGVSPLVGEFLHGTALRADAMIVGGLSSAFVAGVLITIPGLATTARIGAGAVVLVGLGTFAGGMTAVVDRRTAASNRVAAVFPGTSSHPALVAAAAGSGVVAVGLVSEIVQLTAVGVWTVLVSMIVLSVQPERFGWSVTSRNVVAWSGVAFVMIAGYQLFAGGTFGRSPSFTLFVVLTVALAGGLIVWRGATLFVGVLVGFALVWTLFGHVVADRAQVSGRRPGAPAARIVALGDSFMSGEGAERFFVDTDRKGHAPNECRRAPTAYPLLLAADLATGSSPDTGLSPDTERVLEPGDVDLLACSGATIDDVVDLQPRTPGDGDCDRLGQYPCGPVDVYGADLQLSSIASDHSATRLVLISIGGNDVRFGDIVKGCLLPGTCAERREVWLDNVAALGPRLTATYSRVREAFEAGSANPPAIVVMPYPLVLTESTCARSPLDAREHQFVYDFTTVLDQEIEASAREAGVNYFADGMFALAGHRLCEDDDLAINLIALQSTDGPLVDRLNPGSWVHNSMHPNERGHQMIAGALAGWLEADDIVGAGNPDPIDGARSERRDVRTPGPLAISPASRAALTALDPTPFCDLARTAGFPTRVTVFDEQRDGSDGSDAFAVPIVGAAPTSPICVATGTGWTELVPRVADAGESETMDPGDGVVATVEEGQVLVTGGRPAAGCASAEDVCAYQWVMFAGSDDQSGDVDGSVLQLRGVRYCSRDPDCENTFADWRAAKVAAAARTVTPSLVLIFVGGWMAALGWSLARRPPILRWLGIDSPNRSVPPTRARDRESAGLADSLAAGLRPSGSSTHPNSVATPSEGNRCSPTC